MNYATRKRRGRICWASQLKKPNERLDGVVERVREDYFAASLLVVLPNGEIHAAEVFERGKRLAMRGKSRCIPIRASLFWAMVEAARKADSEQTKGKQ